LDLKVVTEATFVPLSHFKSLSWKQL